MPQPVGPQVVEPSPQGGQVGTPQAGHRLQVEPAAEGIGCHHCTATLDTGDTDAHQDAPAQASPYREKARESNYYCDAMSNYMHRCTDINI